MKHSDSLGEFAKAMAKAQANIGHAIKDKANPFHQSHYADLAGVKDACNEHLTENGFCIIQAPSTLEGGAVSLTTRLLHESGEWMEETMSAAATPDKHGRITAQALGSVVTYLRRYMLSSMAGVATEDDDGERAMGRGDGSGDKVKPTAPKKEPDRIDVTAADYVVPTEFWERPHLGLAKEPNWKINDWLAHFGAYIEQAPNEATLDRFWADNEPNIIKLSDVRQYWCREVWTARMSQMMPPDTEGDQ